MSRVFGDEWGLEAAASSLPAKRFPLTLLPALRCWQKNLKKGNQDERDFGILTSRFDKLPDSEFIRQAYLRWGKDCVGCIYGDWSFAVWHPKERRLFLARDHFGITSLYYYADEEVFAFTSSRKARLMRD